MISASHRIALACVALSAVPLICQTIRVTVDLVQVDAVVTDENGRHVPRLKAEDFQIYEDGKPQAITHFEYVHTDLIPVEGPSGSRTTAAPSIYSPAPSVLRPEQVRRTIVLLADDLGLSFGDIPRIKSMLGNFIDHQMQPGDLVSIMTSSGGTGALDRFTGDKRLLHAAVDRIQFFHGRNGFTWYEPIHETQTGRQGVIAAITQLRVAGLGDGTYAQGSAAALRYAIEGLRELPGRKAIALFSDGGINYYDSVVEAANRASVVVYTFDARGLETFNLSALDSIYADTTAQNIGGAENSRQRKFVSARTSMDMLARGTGGIFFRDNNGLSEGLGAALDDMNSYYLIGYQPHREDFEPADGKAAYHRIQVKVSRPGLHVRSRQGFLGVPDEAASTAPVSSSDQLRHALSSPFAATGIPVQLSAFYSTGAADAKSRHLPVRLRAMMMIDARALKFEDLPNGKKKLRLDALAAAFGADNEPVGMNDETFLADLSPEEAERLEASGLVYSLNITLTRPGPWQLRAAVRDRNSGLLGSASSFVEVPDFSQKRIQLTSILLHDADAARDEALAREGFPGAGSAVTRVFAQGAMLTWECNVTGTVPDHASGQPRIDVEVQLYRGPERIFSGRPIPLAVHSTSISSIYAAGTIKLPATLPPGSYSLELMAHDRGQKVKLQEATQWTDFTIARSGS